MKNKTDDIFREKLSNVEQTPNPQSWEKISAQLAGKSVRKNLPFWWTVSGMAASVALVTWFSVSQEKTAIIIPKNNKSLVKSNIDNLAKAKRTDFLKNTEKIQFSENLPIHNPESESKRIASKQNLWKQNHKFEDSIQVVENSSFEEIDRVEMPAIPVTVLRKQVEKHELPEIVFIVENENNGTFLEDIPKKKSKISRVFAEIKKLKKGEKVNYKELSLDKKVILASVREKFQ
jgi:hypothetical protein